MAGSLHSVSSLGRDMIVAQERAKVEAATVSPKPSLERILFVTPRYFPYVGGVQNHVYQVASRFARLGMDITVLTTNPGGRLPSHENMDGVKVRRVRAWPARRDYYFAPDIYRIITREHWDLVHVQSYHTLVAPLAMCAAWRANVPYLVTFHGGGHSSRLRHSMRGVQQRLLRPLLARADRLVAVSQFEIPLLSRRLKLLEERFALIPNGADLPNIAPEQTEAVDESLIVSIGRLERYKGHQRIIAALPNILSQRPDVRLWIAGEGPYESDLRKLAHKLGVADRVDIHAVPATERERMAREISKAALVVLLSDYETHPIAVLEAVALGRPALVTDTSGLSELAQRGMAQAIPLNSSPAQVADAVLKNLGRRVNLPHLDIPTWDDCCTGLLSLYSEVTGRTLCVSLMLAQNYAPIIGGEERHVQDLSIELVKRGHDVAVATLHVPGAAEFELDHGVRVYRIKSSMQRIPGLYSRAERSHAPPFPDPEVMLALRHLILSEQPQIVHAHNWMLHSFLPLKAWSGAPLVVSVHSYNLACVQLRLMHFGELCSGPNLAKCLRCASHHYGTLKGSVTTLTHRLSQPAVRAAVDMFLPVSMATAVGNGLIEKELPFQIIPNFLPDEIDLPSGEMNTYFSQLPEDGYLLFVGDLKLDKGIGVLLQAYAELQNPPPLVLIGRKCPDTPTDLPKNVFLLGSWPHAAVMEAYRRSSLSLLPSLCPETFGIAVIEAMSMGRPVISSKIGGLSDVIFDGENGFLVPPGDVVGLKKAIQRLLDDPELREQLGRGALRRAQDFRASVVVSRIKSVYNGLLQAKTKTESLNNYHELLSYDSAQEQKEAKVKL